MDIEFFREYCLKKPLTEEDMPFGDNVLVFKTGGKLFALCDFDSFESINLKCNPERAIELRAKYADIIPGYHMNKKHWNTVYVNRNLGDKQILELIDHSFDLVFNSLPGKLKNPKFK